MAKPEGEDSGMEEPDTPPAEAMEDALLPALLQERLMPAAAAPDVEYVDDRLRADPTEDGLIPDLLQDRLMQDAAVHGEPHDQDHDDERPLLDPPDQPCKIFNSSTIIISGAMAILYLYCSVVKYCRSSFSTVQ